MPLYTVQITDEKIYEVKVQATTADNAKEHVKRVDRETWNQQLSEDNFLKGRYTIQVTHSDTAN